MEIMVLLKLTSYGRQSEYLDTFINPSRTFSGTLTVSVAKYRFKNNEEVMEFLDTYGTCDSVLEIVE